jgi:hypothetical protein
MGFSKSRRHASKQFRHTLETPADFKRSELDIVSFDLISDVDALDSCGGRTTVNGPFAGTMSAKNQTRKWADEDTLTTG